jgi:hypothetical protein
MEFLERRTIELEDDVSFYEWAARAWPRARYTVDVDPLGTGAVLNAYRELTPAAVTGPSRGRKCERSIRGRPPESRVHRSSLAIR